MSEDLISYIDLIYQYEKRSYLLHKKYNKNK